MTTPNRFCLAGLRLTAAAVLLAASPALAVAGTQAAAPAAAPAVTATAPAASCGHQQEPLAALDLQHPAQHATLPSGPVCALGLDESTAGRKFRGFCTSGCSFTPDCNTSADCFGCPCLSFHTCNAC